MAHRKVYKNLTAIVWKEGKWYVAKCLEVEVASQGKSKKEAVENLKEALELYFEDEPKELISLSPKVSIEKISFHYA